MFIEIFVFYFLFGNILRSEAELQITFYLEYSLVFCAS